MHDVIYDFTLKHYGLPWWAWTGELFFLSFLAMRTSITISWLKRDQLDRQNEIFREVCYAVLDYFNAVALRFDAGCTCRKHDDCGVHGKLIDRAELDPRIMDFIKAADLKRTFDITDRMKKQRDDAEFLAREEQKLNRAEMAKTQAQQREQDREDGERKTRENLQRLAKKKRDEEMRAHQIAEAARKQSDDNKNAIFEQLGADAIIAEIRKRMSTDQTKR